MVFLGDLADGDKPIKGSTNNHKKLGNAGLALHYANIITQIDTLVSLPLHSILCFLYHSFMTSICFSIFRTTSEYYHSN